MEKRFDLDDLCEIIADFTQVSLDNVDIDWDEEDKPTGIVVTNLEPF